MMTEFVAVPCDNCGGELYDSVRKYHMNVECAELGKCWNFEHFSKGSYCPHCNALQTSLAPEVAEAERKELFE